MPGLYAVFHKQLGDLVLLEPALRKLREHHGSPVRLLTRSGHEPLVELMVGVEIQRGLAWEHLRHLYAFDPLSKTAFRSLLARAGRKTCLLPDAYELRWFAKFVFGRLLVPGLGDTYVAEYFWKHTPVPSLNEFVAPRLSMPPAEWAPTGAGSPRSFVLLNPTSGWQKKSWHPDRWGEALASLGHGHRFLITSGPIPWQVEHAHAVAARLPSATVVTGTHMQQFLWLCANAAAVLTVDGAASHLAAAFQVPCLTLFGPTNAKNWHRPGPLAQHAQAPPSEDGICRMKNLQAEEVEAAARSTLSRVPASKGI